MHIASKNFPSKLLSICTVLSLLVACGKAIDEPHKDSVETTGSAAADASGTTPANTAVRASADDAVVARVGERTITVSQADASLQLALHDLEVQKYRLRRQVLEAELLRSLQSGGAARPTAEILLTPPAPPRLNLSTDNPRTRPATETPVTVLAFCNFESPHCARLQLTLAQVLPLFAGSVRYSERDFPLPFHRHAGAAAEAARCALEQGNYWRFHDQLYATGGTPNRAALDRAARAVNLETKRFAECLDSGRHTAKVAADVAEAESLGLSTVPAVFVNGVYASPEVRPADLIWLIERELATRGLASPRQVAAAGDSSVPALLRALISSPVPGQGLVLLAPSISPEQSRTYHEGDAVSTGLVLRRITAQGIELLRDGQVERLGWNGPVPPTATTPAAPPEPALVSPHRAVPVILQRDEVLALLSDRINLSQALQVVPMTTDGYHQLRIREVAPGSLYEVLGFQPGDVILSVNEQPVHEASNPLWDALEKEGEVRVRVIRRGGLAKHFTYQFDD